MHFRVKGKRDKIRFIPAHPTAQRLISEYLDALTHHIGAEVDLDGPLFRPVKNNRTGTLDRQAQTATDSLPPFASFPTLDEPWLRELVHTTLELDRVSHSIERPQVDQDWLERESSNHALDSPLPAILLYFCPGDAVMACFDDEYEYWGQETPEPNLIISLQPEDQESVRQALSVLQTLMRVLVLTVRIKNLVESREKPD